MLIKKMRFWLSTRKLFSDKCRSSDVLYICKIGAELYGDDIDKFPPNVKKRVLDSVQMLDRKRMMQEVWGKNSNS